MLADTVTYAKSCIQCQKFYEITRYFPDIVGENKIIPMFPNEALSIDILYMQPATTGEKYILSIMDMYSRFCRFYPIRDMLAETISTKIIDHCCLFGFPNTIFTDDASNLSAALSKNIFAFLQVAHSVSITYRHNPSMVERIHRPLKKGLSLLCHGAEATWPKYVSKVTYAINTSLHSSIDRTPLEAFFFRQNNPQPNLGDCTLNETCDPDLLNEIKELRIIIAETSETMKADYIQKKNKNISNPPILSPDEKVMMRKSALEPGINRKMQEIRSGPWIVTKVINSEITISLLEYPSIVRTRHISHLAPFIERPNHLAGPGPTITEPALNNIYTLDPSTITGDFSSPSFLKL